MMKDVVTFLLTIALAGLALAASPPDLINYQGVLRDASDAPLDGDYDMVFRFYKTDTIADAILVNSRIASLGCAVTVSGGLFNVQLGSCEVNDGPDAGIYTSLAEVFRDYSTVYLEIEVDGEVLSPRVRIISAGYALNADHLDGRDSGYFLNMSSDTQSKYGTLNIEVEGTAFALEASGEGGAGFFEDPDDSGLAYVAYGNTGIEALGSERGGYFHDSDSSGYAYVGYGNYGIAGYGNTAGGFFDDLDGSGYAYVGYSNHGIRGFGGTAGGYFEDTDNSGYASVGEGHYGIRAYGNTAGGYFEDLTSSSYVYAAYGYYGIRGYGSTAGGYFKDTDHSGNAFVGIGDTGISASGTAAGGHFQDDDDLSYAYLANDHWGINSYGDVGGGYFEDLTSGTYLRAANDTSSTSGNGAKNFIQNHPHNDDLVIVYAAIEGDEVATYTRGTARLVSGEARVALGETFKWVTNPEIGLTAHLTPHGDCQGLYVESLGTEELVVRELGGGTSDVVFDYVVFGLRIGFEDQPTVREKVEDAYLPDMTEVLEIYQRRPELRSTSPLERFRSTSMAAGLTVPDDLTESRELIQAIGTYDPTIHRETLQEQSESERPAPETADTLNEITVDDQATPGDVESLSLSPASPTPMLSPTDNMSAAKMTASLRVPMKSVVPVEPGQVLVFDPDHPGMVRPAATVADPTMVGVALGAADSSEVQVALAGLVECRVDAGYGAIRIGDLLTASPTPGHAMYAYDPKPGTIIGKALEPLDHGTGTITILVMLR